MKIKFVTIAAALAFSPAAFSQVSPVAGDVAVTEIMFNPGLDACVTDANGEYFELLNISSKALDLSGTYFSDVTAVAGEYFQIPAGALPTLYPGQMFVFCRRADMALNGGVICNYEYSVTTGNPVPPDKSKVSSTAMMFGNSATAIDGVKVYSASAGAPGSGLEVIIEQASYTSGAAPFNVSGSSGVSVERKDPFAPMVATSGPLTNSTNAAQSTGAHFGPCNQFATPGARNSVDVTVNWPNNVPFDSVNYPNPGLLSCKYPLSLGFGSVIFHLDGGGSMGGFPFTIGYSDNIPFEYPLELLLGGSPGSLILDVGTIGFIDDPNYALDVNGVADAVVPIPNNPIIIGSDFNVQWLAVDFGNFIVLGSQGLRVRISE